MGGHHGDGTKPGTLASASFSGASTMLRAYRARATGTRLHDFQPLGK